MESIKEELADLAYRLSVIAGHINIATVMINKIYEPNKKLDESIFVSCMDLIEEKTRQLNEVYKALDQLTLKF